jgi:AraC-like DNA-binding protein
MLIDGIFASIVALRKRGTGKPCPAPHRADPARLATTKPCSSKHFGCEVRFDAPVDLLVFDEEGARGAVRHAQPAAPRGHRAGTRIGARGEASGRRSLADDVRAALSQRISGERPAVEKVAKSLGMSPRTLQRRLEELGTSYQKLLDEVRRRSARRLLANTDLGAGEVAFLLGFEELNSFTRAFHAWEGTTPLRWRASAARKHEGATP